MFNIFKKDKKPKNIKAILKFLESLDKKIGALSEGLEKLKEESKFSVQKVGVVRYNPFSDVGGDQSFSIALLDANNDGIVITGLYGREGNRVYAKPIKNSESEYPLSGEEKKAIKKAIKKNDND